MKGEKLFYTRLTLLHLQILLLGRDQEAGTDEGDQNNGDHRRVKSNPPPISRPTPVAVPPKAPGLVFGVPLANVLKDKNGQPWPSCVPPIVEDTVNYLEARGTDDWYYRVLV